jgi:hypothetical protein
LSLNRINIRHVTHSGDAQIKFAKKPLSQKKHFSQLKKALIATTLTP